MDFSITLRPRYKTFLDINQKLFHTLIKDDKKINKYIISNEKGKGEDFNHLQIFLSFHKKTSTANVRRFLITKLKKINIKLDEEEEKVGLKVREIKSNLEGTIGYTLKEEGTKYTNYTDNELNGFSEIYQEHIKEDGYDKKQFFRISNKNYHIHIRNYISQHSEHQLDFYEKEDLLRIIGDMINKGYFFTFLNARNTTNVVNYALAYLNKTGEDYITDLFDKSTMFD